MTTPHYITDRLGLITDSAHQLACGLQDLADEVITTKTTTFGQGGGASADIRTIRDSLNAARAALRRLQDNTERTQ